MRSRRFGREANIFSIPPGAPFLPTLVDALVSGDLVPGFSPQNDPLALSTATIWVPTRRAVRVLAGEFVARCDGEVALLPDIRALGDFEEEDIFSNPVAHDGVNAKLALTPQMGAVERQVTLARLIAKWAESLKEAQKSLFQDADIIIPASVSDAIWFAADLAALMDTMATEEVSWSTLDTLIEDQDLAEWWQLTLEFLKIASKAWPEILETSGAKDATVLRAQSLRARAEHYRTDYKGGPVIAAGSTGSIPATADLLATIAHMPNGALVLPALDRDLDEETWQKVDLPDNDRDSGGVALGHPQYGLKKLLEHIGVLRGSDDIRHIGGIDNMASGFARLREYFISEALRPPESTVMWQSILPKLEKTERDDAASRAFKGVAIVEAKGEREEALAIALALRETLEGPKKTVALVTPDRNLARRVAVEMRRFGVPVDDSAGLPLRNRSPGTFARLVLQVAFAPSDVVALTSLLKHPLACFGATAERARRAADLFEIVVLRGAIDVPQHGALLASVNEKQLDRNNENSRTPPAIERLSDSDWHDVRWLAARLDELFPATPTGERDDTPQPAFDLAQHTVALVESIAEDEENGHTNLYGSDAGQGLQSFLADLLQEAGDFEIPPSQWPLVFDALLGERTVRSTGGTHPRIAILGPLEARLQTFDRVVLGGLNEKTWPASARNDPFLSRPMKLKIGLPPPERRTGLAAHDFQVLLGMEDVVLTRSLKADNAPTVASRWLQRMTIVAGETATKAMREQGRKYTDWARAIDKPVGDITPCKRPDPRPPVDLRPQKLSVTQIATWIEDPYAIYAGSILKLKALEPLIREPDAREKGSIYHKIMEQFVGSNIDPFADDAITKLLAIARIEFQTSNVPPEHIAMWLPRFTSIAESYLSWHRENVTEGTKSHVELSGNTSDGLDGFTLSGRFDRIDIDEESHAHLYDYKTSDKPGVTAVRDGSAPQLPLEAAMAQRGAFKQLGSVTPWQMSYIRLLPDDRFKVDKIAIHGGKNPTQTVVEMADDVWERLRLLVRAYRDPDKPYLSKARRGAPKKWVSDFDHLARVAEWSTAEDREGDT